MNKKQLLLNLRHGVYCRIMPSKVHGVGVFAIRDIPKGKNPFPGAMKARWLGLTRKELKGLDKEVADMVTAFFAKQSDKIWVPSCGLNGIDISFFMNTSNKPNIQVLANGDKFRTIRLIKKGEELLIDYEKFDENILEQVL